MSRRFIVAVAATMLAFAPAVVTTAAAQVPDGPRVLTPTPSFISSFGPSITLADLEIPAVAAEQVPAPQNPFRPRSNGPSAIMASLYVSTAVVQALDTHSTIVGLERGAYEANPLMSGLTKNKAAFIGVKAAVAVGTILAARSMAKRNKVAAVVTLVALNSVYAYVAQHNYRVASRIR